MTEQKESLTHWLQMWREGDRDAWTRVVERVYPALKKLAATQLNQGGSPPEGDMQATALVHEAFFKLMDQQGVDWQNRDHFFSICSRLMRRVLIDSLREMHARKRGGGADHLPLEKACLPVDTLPLEAMAVNDALHMLAEADPVAARVAELRYLIGLSTEETAQVLGVGVATVGRHWRFARAWLQTTLNGEPHGAVC